MGLALTSAPVAAQGTPEQRAACQGDAQRLCGQYIPDIDGITACMTQNRRYSVAVADTHSSAEQASTRSRLRVLRQVPCYATARPTNATKIRELPRPAGRCLH